jgi:hypothetical protein
MKLDSIPSIIEALARTPEIVVPLVREVPPALQKRRPSPGRWSVHEHACHLAQVHPLFFDRLETMLHETTPVITPYDPGRNDSPDLLLSLDLDESLDRFTRDRARLVEILRSLSPQQWLAQATHDEYSRYSVFIMFRHLVMHDMLHAYRIEELLLKREWAEEHAVS